jgi:hypothetical protein
MKIFFITVSIMISFICYCGGGGSKDAGQDIVPDTADNALDTYDAVDVKPDIVPEDKIQDIPPDKAEEQVQDVIEDKIEDQALPDDGIITPDDSVIPPDDGFITPEDVPAADDFTAPDDGTIPDNLDVPPPEDADYIEIFPSDADIPSETPSDIPQEIILSCKNYPDNQIGFTFNCMDICDKITLCGTTMSYNDCIDSCALLKTEWVVPTTNKYMKCITDTQCASLPPETSIDMYCLNSIYEQEIPALSSVKKQYCDSFTEKLNNLNCKKNEILIWLCPVEAIFLRESAWSNYIQCKDKENCMEITVCTQEAACSFTE